MGIMKKLINLLSSLSKKKEEELPSTNHIFNCKDLAWITSIKHWRYTPDMYTHSFSLYWSSGFEVRVQQDTTDPESCPDLSKLRELFINNIGYSYVNLDVNSNIYIYHKPEKK